MSQKPEALRLAECLEDLRYTTKQQADEASAMLRNQHAEIERLRAELAAMRNQEPVAWMNVRNGFICKKPTNADYQQPLYLAAGAGCAPSVPEVTDTMALSFHCALTAGRISAGKLEEIKVGLRAALAAAPEAPEAPKRGFEEKKQ